MLFKMTKILLILLIIAFGCNGQTIFRGVTANEITGTPPLVPDVSHIEFFISTSASGSDDGLTELTPWSIAQAKAELESVTPDSGDYAFKRGDTWEQKDSIVINTNPTAGNITLTSYGTGALPNIRGGINITGDTWTHEGGNLWWASTASHGDRVYAVHLDGVQSRVAHHPNGLFAGLVITGTSGGTNVQLAGYDAEDGPDADGGFCAISGRRWKQDYITITSATNNVLTLASSVDGDITVGGSVKLYDFKEAADSQGEWWYDSALDRIYIFSTTNPGTTAYNEIIITVNEKFAFHISDGADNVTIELLKISHFHNGGIWVTGQVPGHTIKNNTIEDLNMYGIFMDSHGASPAVTDMKIMDNNINNCNTGGIFAGNNVDQATIIGNTIDSIQLWYGYGKFESWIGSQLLGHGIQFLASNNDDMVINDNTITHTGAAGMNILGQSADIFDNIYDNNLRHVGDMGAMYTYGGLTGSSNEDINVVRARITNVGWDGTMEWFKGDDNLDRRGMYFDGHTQNSRFDSSFIADSPAMTTAIMVPQGSSGITLNYDTVSIGDHGSFVTQGIFIGSKFATDVTELTTWTNMWITADGDDARCIGVNDTDNTLMADWTWPTSIDNNNYDRTNSADFLYHYNGSHTHTFTEWQTDTGMDGSSTDN